MVVRPTTEDPNLFWDNHFRDPKTNKDHLVVNLAFLRSTDEFTDIQAAIRSFLIHHPEQVEPWMYELLAVALVMNKGRAADVNTALGYAADLAARRKKAHELTRVADTLAMHDLHDRAGQLLDLASDLEPGNPVPMVMSMSLAERTRNPERMTQAVERFLALGWPETDETWRRETRVRVEALVKTLEEEGRSEEGARLLASLDRSEGRDLFVRLSWAGDADLSLIVDEPLGATARVASPRTVFGGALVANGYGEHPEEIYVCPRGFDGDYQIRVERLQGNPDDPARDITLEIVTREGTAEEQAESRPISLPASSPVVVRLEGGRRRTVLPYQAPAATDGVTVTFAGPGAGGVSRSSDVEQAPTAPTLSPTDAADALRLPPTGVAPAPR